MKPQYSGPNHSGICICGHDVNSHHLSIVAKQDYIDETGEMYIPGACLYYGCNENEGLDSEGNDHCFGYIDNPYFKEAQAAPLDLQRAAQEER